MKIISKGHSDVIGILFGLLSGTAAILIILMACGVIKLKCSH